MKMPRSQCESENVQFVQELAEVDGPFEAPININFRDLTKLELPSLVWNRGYTCPKKMKITNTGHTVIISGKWKCERPYLTGGPLLGKYVFSQIHFHWGQDDCVGSEHQICGEGYPLEMHVTHFKTEYLTQECALREKDGMVVVVYLFKLQEEPNESLKKVISSLSCVKQPSTSYGIDPRPILSFCNPFTDDYFMYWGSVVTSTCAHILLWIICREPFGISREQVQEFRKIMDSYHQPICKNSRDIQPLRKRNVFHVNASKHLDEPLLPIKTILTCHCKGGEDNARQLIDCEVTLTPQENVEGNFTENETGNQCLHFEGMQTLYLNPSSPNSCFPRQTFFVQKATVHTPPLALRRSGSDPVGNYCCLENLKKIKSEGHNSESSSKQVKLVSQSCCSFPEKEVKKIKSLAEARKVRERKRPFNSIKAFTQIMHSLETLKNHTFKKLKEIESINQEIKEIKPFCQETEDKRWLRKIEKIMTRQKRFTIKSSQGCLKELKKLAKECNFDKFFDARALPVGENDKMPWLANGKLPNTELPVCDPFMKGEGFAGIKTVPSKHLEIKNVSKFSLEAQRFIQSFFEDIKDSEDLQNTVRTNFSLKKLKSLSCRQGDSISVLGETPGYITQKMFVLGNLGNRFFTEVTAEDLNMDENESEDEKQTDEVIIIKEVSETNIIPISYEDKAIVTKELAFEINESLDSKPKHEILVIPLHKANIGIALPKTGVEETQIVEKFERVNSFLKDEDRHLSPSRNTGGSELELSNLNLQEYSPKNKTGKTHLLKSEVVQKGAEFYELKNAKLTRALKGKLDELSNVSSSSILSTESLEIQRVTVAKYQKSKKDFWEQKRQASDLIRLSSKRLFNKSSGQKFEGLYVQKKNVKSKNGKSQRGRYYKRKSSHGFSSTSKEDRRRGFRKSKRKRVKKAKFKLEIEKMSDSTAESALENSIISPKRKKLKLDYKRPKTASSGESLSENNFYLTDTLTTRSSKCHDSEFPPPKKESFAERDYADFKCLEENLSLKQRKNINKKHKSRVRVISIPFTKKTSRPSSMDSIVTKQPKQPSTKMLESEVFLQRKEGILPKETSGSTGTKHLFKNRSFSNITPTQRFTSESTHRKYLESIQDRRNSNKNSSSVVKKKIEEMHKAVAFIDFSGDEINNNFDQQQDIQKITQASETNRNLQIQNANFGNYVTTSIQVDNEFLYENPDQKTKETDIILKRCDAEKYSILVKKRHDFNTSFQEPIEECPEIVHQTDSNKSFTQDAYKKDGCNHLTTEKHLQTSFSCSTLKKGSFSRPYSAETLQSQTKSSKRKSKKRPHCCKKSSKHFARKNNSVLKKPSKAENKSLNLLNFTEEEQLKIISVNVAKYLKQTFAEEKSELGSKKDSISYTAKEALTKIDVVQQQAEKPLRQEPRPISRAETRPNKIPVLKAKLDKSDKSEKTEKDKNIKENETIKKTKTVNPPIEIGKKTALPPLPKSGNNFIKLNKQMAGRYKKSAQSVANEVKLKENEKYKFISDAKGNTENKSNDVTAWSEAKPNEIENPKPKVIIKKKKTKVPVQKVKTQSDSKPGTPLSDRSQKVFPTKEKEKQPKSLNTLKKPDPKIKKPKKILIKPDNAVKQNKSGKPEPEREPKPAKVVRDGTPPPVVKFEGKRSRIPKCKESSLVPVETVHGHGEYINRTVPQKKEAKPENGKLEIFHEDKGNILEVNTSEAMFKKELEYFIRLQMCLNSEISSSLENPANFHNTGEVNQNRETNVDSLQYVDSSNKAVVLVGTKNLLERYGSCSNVRENPVKYNPTREITDAKTADVFKTKELVTLKTPKELSDAKMQNQPNDVHEESHSDSSYDCKISITLNANPDAAKGADGVQDFDLFNSLIGNRSKSATCLGGASSLSMIGKIRRKKQKENNIPLEMKQKLLELLEGEINREVGLTCQDSSENSSEGSGLKREDSSANNRSQSPESSLENMEVLTQISNTMKQYLTYLKENKRLSDRESKETDEF